MSDIVQMVTTTETKADALRVAKHLVEQRLAACVQIIGPITSVYWWEGEVQQAEEYQCLVKTQAAMVAQVTAAITAVHPYDTPEVIATPITGGSRDYQRWVMAETMPNTTREA